MRFFLILVFLPSYALGNCSSRTITDKLTDIDGQELISESNQVSCSEGSPSLESLVGIDSKCNVYEVQGQPQMACKYPNGRWEVISDIEAFDALTGSESPISTHMSTRQDFITDGGSGIVALFNLARWSSGILDSSSQELHERSVFLTLENAANGEVVKWRNPEMDTSGKMKVVLTTAVQGGICRKVLIEIKKGNHPQNISETACRDLATNQWRFIQ
jgi:hypothetical protein